MIEKLTNEECPNCLSDLFENTKNNIFRCDNCGSLFEQQKDYIYDGEDEYPIYEMVEIKRKTVVNEAFRKIKLQKAKARWEEIAKQEIEHREEQSRINDIAQKKWVAKFFKK